MRRAATAGQMAFPFPTRYEWRRTAMEISGWADRTDFAAGGRVPLQLTSAARYRNTVFCLASWLLRPARTANCGSVWNARAEIWSFSNLYRENGNAIHYPTFRIRIREYRRCLWIAMARSGWAPAAEESTGS